MTESATVVVADPAEAIVSVLRASEQPLTIAQIQERYSGPNLTKNKLQALIKQKVEQKELFACSPLNRQARYWDRDELQRVRDQIRSEVEKALAGKNLTEAEVVKAVGAALGKAAAPKAVKEAVARLRDEKRVFNHPGKTAKSPLLSLKPYDPLANLAVPAAALKSLKTLWERAAQAGVPLEGFLRKLGEVLTAAQPTQPVPAAPPVPAQQTAPEPAPAPAPTRQPEPEPAAPLTSAPPGGDEEVRQLVLKAVNEAGPSVPVSVAELRRHLPEPYRGTLFDRAVWKLKEENQLFVVRHNHPGILSDEEREELLKDDEGGYYVDIAQSGR